MTAALAFVFLVTYMVPLPEEKSRHASKQHAGANMTNKLTRKEVAELFDVSPGTVRTWQGEFTSWLETKIQPAGGGSYNATEYTQADVIVFATVRRLTKAGMNYDEVREALNKEIPKTKLPKTDEEQQPEEVDDTTALIPWTDYSAVVASLQGSEAKANALEDERNFLRGRVSELEEKLEVEIRRSWWQKLRGK